jgi:small-conductance mechanosensitive channel
VGKVFEHWIFQPAALRLIVAFLGLLFIGLLVQISQRYVARQFHDTDTRYRARRFVNSMGYLAYIVIITILFGKELGGLAVALGVAGAVRGKAQPAQRRAPRVTGGR